MKPNQHHILFFAADSKLIELIIYLIQNNGCLPISATTEEEGVQLIRKLSPVAIVLFDWEFLTVNYPGFLNRVREVSPVTRRLVLCNYATPEIEEGVRNKDFCCYLCKPFKIDHFNHALKKCINEFEEKTKPHSAAFPATLPRY